MHFKKNGNGKIETNWKTLMAMASVLGVIITIISLTIKIGIGYGNITTKLNEIAVSNQVIIAKQDITDIKIGLLNVGFAKIETELINQDKRIDKLER